jgi:predicted membrane channel-forming protein YqfA (hemolysin III family)
VWFIAPIYFNEPEHIFGFPLLYAWCTGIGIIWLIGCMFFGFRIEKEREEFKKNNQI